MAAIISRSKISEFSIDNIVFEEILKNGHALLDLNKMAKDLAQKSVEISASEIKNSIKRISSSMWEIEIRDFYPNSTTKTKNVFNIVWGLRIRAEIA